MAKGKRANGGGSGDRQVARMVKNVVESRLEHKYFDQVTNNYALFGGTTAGITVWTQVPQGTAAGQRVGVKIDPVKFSYRYSAALTGSAPRRARLVLFQWMVNSQVQPPTPGSILQNVGTQGDLLASEYRIVLGRQFHILSDESFNLNPTTHTSIHGHKVFRNLRQLSYDQGANLGIGCIYSMWILDSGISPGDLSVDIGTRLEFTDA